LHWIIYALPVVVFVIAILLVLGGGGWIAGSVLGVIAFVLFLPPWIKASSSEFAITNKRVLIKVGLIRRHSLELLLQKVEGIGVDQGIELPIILWLLIWGAKPQSSQPLNLPQ
jgi:hypothetical protein